VKSIGSTGGTPWARAPDSCDCVSTGVASSVSTKLRMVVPSRPQCSTLMPARPSANTTNETALSNQRLPLSPCSSWSQAFSVSAGAKSSRHTQNRARSIVSSAAAFVGSARSPARLAAQSARALVVRCPTAVSVAARIAPALTAASSPARRSSRA
jgi:hypothetical protein